MEYNMTRIQKAVYLMNAGGSLELSTNHSIQRINRKIIICAQYHTV